jgi:endoglucanase
MRFLRSPLRTWVALLAGIGLPILGHIAPSHTAASPVGAPLLSTDIIAVSGPRVLLNNRRFPVKGVVIVGMVAPDGVLRGPYIEAHRHFGEKILREARAWGANTIRFQLSQPGLDPQGALYSSSYVSEVTRAMALARSLGFVVIASIQDQPPSGETLRVRMPTAATLRANLTLGALVKEDRGIIIELFNEPALRPSPENWTLWQRGGLSPEGFPVVGMQTIIDNLRQEGVGNLLAVDGLRFSKSFDGMPPLSDPLGQIVFAVHPYLMGNGHPQLWQWRFGFLTDAGKPVIATEWSAPTRLKRNGNAWCLRFPPETPARELQFLAAKEIGIVGWAFDFPGTLVADFNCSGSSSPGINGRRVGRIRKRPQAAGWRSARESPRRFRCTNKRPWSAAFSAAAPGRTD